MQLFSRMLLSIIVVSLINLNLLNLICKNVVFLILKSVCQILRVEQKKVFALIFCNISKSSNCWRFFSQYSVFESRPNFELFLVLLLCFISGIFILNFLNNFLSYRQAVIVPPTSFELQTKFLEPSFVIFKRISYAFLYSCGKINKIQVCLPTN